MALRVCIPTAGTGSRLGELTRYLNKSLVSVAGRPVLARLIERFPEETEFVIVLGHKGHLVREFCQVAYPERRFLFAEVDPYEGPGSGLGLSLLACRRFLEQPFIFVSCDTLVREQIPEPVENWAGYSREPDIASYRTLHVESGVVKSVCEKGQGEVGSHVAYIGVAAVRDYDVFWRAMEEGGDAAIAEGEAHGLRALLRLQVLAREFTWFDTGNVTALERARRAFREPEAPNVLEKANEAIWFVGGRVIKFSDDEGFIRNRVRRGHELAGFVPSITNASTHMYAYEKAAGRVLSEAVTVPLFCRLLDYCRNFWRPEPLDEVSRKAFHEACMRFYRTKTLERVDLFFRTSGHSDGTEAINGIAMPTVQSLLDRIDWQWLADGRPGRFHGDLHFENILWSERDRKFTFLDWRQDFGGSLKTGDVYYDLGKLLHGLIVCHELIARDQYQVRWGDRNVEFDFNRKHSLAQCEKAFERWLETEGYDRRKVRFLAALIYLNIAALHHRPYGLLLFALGKSMLHEELES